MNTLKQILATPVFLLWGLAHYRTFWLALAALAGLTIGWILGG